MRPPLLLVVALLASACAASPPAPLEGPPPVATPVAPPPPPPAPALAPTEVAALVPPTPVPAGAVEPAPSGACPPDMVLVEGEYCTEVEHHCLVEWWAPQNKKRVCEQFEPTAKCVGARVPKRYCIDRYEYPNQKGVRPEVMNTFYQAQVKCAALGRRMCTETEWSFACEGPDMKPFPYGFTRDPKKCNGDHRWDGPNMTKVGARDAHELARLWRGVPSGSQPDCVSDFGVADMPGNADEVCAGESPHAKYAAVNTGGPWYSGVRNQCRPKVYTHAEDFYYYFLSFRCCAAPDGAPNEPRTKKQLAEGPKWSAIERLAGFTVDQMKEKLDLKARGECTCKPSDTKCKTMCGTLLGPGAVDGSDATRVLHRDRNKIRPEVGK
ncbi:MAG: SUMF1/EgtB/PvdO family nonheme iron enzyme [Myxococcales bacterium]|nr:SUMF1/EgtB/PvdO family nonheme iron enzyme [Myxococcales bacterium]